MANRLTPVPTSNITWFLECRYCQDSPDKNRHEVELLAKAKRLCKNYKTNHFLDFVTAELDTLNHAILTPRTMVEILTQIHQKVGCPCLSDITTEIQDRIINQHDITPSPAPTHNITPAAQIPATSTLQSRPQSPAKTLLERLQNGRNHTTK